jgi:hypothetical protein
MLNIWWVLGNGFLFIHNIFFLEPFYFHVTNIEYNIEVQPYTHIRVVELQD